MRYPVFFEKSATGFSAWVPDLLGCVATGSNLDATRKLIREAIKMHLAGMREDGEEIPEPPVLVEFVDVNG